ncbi:MAG: M16 family metallopeptidase [Rhodothermales bacterium]
MPKQQDAASPYFDRTVLPNGARVISEKIPSVRSISVGMWVFTGSRDEAPDESGMSHFIEHMVFKGTERRRMHHIAQRMEFVGGYLNAFTAKEYTCYYARALDEHLARAVDAVCDLVLQPKFPPKELEKEKEVVIEEMKMYEDAPEDIIFDHIEALVYRDHALGRPIVGFPETVRSFSRDGLVNYLDAHYTPDRMVLAAAGNVDHEKLVALAEKAFAVSDRTSSDKTRTSVNGYVPEQVVSRRAVHQAHLVLATRGYAIHDERRVALSVLNTVLGGGMSSRLNQNIREKYGYCYNIYSYLNLHLDAGDFGVYMGTDGSKVERSKKLIFRELAKLRDTPVSPRTLNQAKNQVKGSIMLGLESMSNRMMRIGRQDLYFGRYFSLDEILQAVDAVTAEGIQVLAQDLFVPERFSSVVFLPQD